jgi:mRNA-degrading endonuclease RelE of RelBE toxin-antitoxin system
MKDIEILQMPLFKRAYKKLHPKEAALVQDAIRALINNPEIGERKKGDLNGVYVHKFKINRQEMLLAYEWNSNQRILLALGVHENFYRDLKSKYF